MDTIEQLRELHTRLVRAQRVENEAIRRLGGFTAKGRTDQAAFKTLLGAAHAAGRHAVEIYDEWSRLIELLHSHGLQGQSTDERSPTTHKPDGHVPPN
jgi:hypothetical protein